MLLNPRASIKQWLINFGGILTLCSLYPFLSHRFVFWMNRLLSIAYTLRNRNAFYKLGRCSVLYNNVVLHEPNLISIGDNTYVDRSSSLTAWSRVSELHSGVLLEIGSNTLIGEGAHITAAFGIKIGDNVLIGKNVTITDNNHGESSVNELLIPPIQRKLSSKGSVVIEDNVWIGDKATVLTGVTVGFGSVIAANSVVTKNVPKECVVAGVPARIVRRICK